MPPWLVSKKPVAGLRRMLRCVRDTFLLRPVTCHHLPAQPARRVCGTLDIVIAGSLVFISHAQRGRTVEAGICCGGAGLTRLCNVVSIANGMADGEAEIGSQAALPRGHRGCALGGSDEDGF